MTHSVQQLGFTQQSLLLLRFVGPTPSSPLVDIATLLCVQNGEGQGHQRGDEGVRLVVPGRTGLLHDGWPGLGFVER